MVCSLMLHCSFQQRGTASPGYSLFCLPAAGCIWRLCTATGPGACIVQKWCRAASHLEGL